MIFTEKEPEIECSAISDNWNVDIFLSSYSYPIFHHTQHVCMCLHHFLLPVAPPFRGTKLPHGAQSVSLC